MVMHKFSDLSLNLIDHCAIPVVAKPRPHVLLFTPGIIACQGAKGLVQLPWSGAKKTSKNEDRMETYWGWNGIVRCITNNLDTAVNSTTKMAVQTGTLFANQWF